MGWISNAGGGGGTTSPATGPLDLNGNPLEDSKGPVTLPGDETLAWQGMAQLSSPADGSLLLAPTSGSLVKLLLGGTSASFPMLKRNGAGLSLRLADDSADAALTLASAMISGALSAASGSIAGTLSAGAATLASAAVSGNATVGGTLGVSGASTLAGLTAGASTLSAASISGNVSVGGTLGVTGAATLGNLTASAASLASASISGNASVAGTLGVTGSTTLGALTAASSSLSSVAVSGNASVGGTLGVTGASTLAGLTAGATGVTTLSTSGLATLASSSITGNETVGGTLTVTGAASFTSLNSSSAGSASTPSMAVATGSGLYVPATGQLGVAAGSVGAITVTGAEVVASVNQGTVTTLNGTYFDGISGLLRFGTADKSLLGYADALWVRTGDGSTAATMKAKNFYTTGSDATSGDAVSGWNGNVAAGATRAFRFNNSTRIQDTADGILKLTTNAGAAISKLSFGPYATTSIMLKLISGTTPQMQFRLGDDSDYANVALSALTATGAATLSSATLSGTLGVTGVASLVNATVTGTITCPQNTSIPVFYAAGRAGPTAPIADATIPMQLSTGAAVTGDTNSAYYGVNKNGAYGLFFGYSVATTAVWPTGGLFRMVTADPFSIVVNNNTLAATFASNGTVAFAGAVTLPVGAVGTPSLNFAGATTTGLFYSTTGSNRVGLSVGGALVASIDQYACLRLPMTSNTFPSQVTGVRLGPDDATGVIIFRNGTGVVQFGLGDGSANAAMAGKAFQTTNMDGTVQYGPQGGNLGLYFFYDTSNIAANQYGILLQQRLLVATRTGDYTVLKADTGKRQIFSGSSAQPTAYLPAATTVGGTAAMLFVFVSGNSFGVKIKPAGTDIIQFPNAASTASTGYASCATAGQVLRLFCATTGVWSCDAAPSVGFSVT